MLETKSTVVPFDFSGASTLDDVRLPRRFVVGIDFSETSEHALDVALSLARATNGRVTMLHAWHESSLKALGEVVLPGITFDSIDDCRARLDRIAKDRAESGVTLDVATTIGESAKAIDDFASSVGADVIVTGTHGRSGLRRLVMGSVAEELVHHATTPVLVVPPTAEASAR